MDSAVTNEEKSAETVALEREIYISELNEPRWAVVSFESVAFRNLTYEEARIWVEKLKNQNISGLCIITDEAAARSRH